MLIDGIANLADRPAGVVVVGSGPVGLAFATDLARRGVPVLLLESGGRGPNSAAQGLSSAEILDPARHDDMAITVARRLGGTSNLWGGRCLPYDPVDYVARDWIDARWPIGQDAITPYITTALRTVLAGEPVFTDSTPLVPGADPSFDADTLERWVNIQASQTTHREAIANDPLLEVRTHATVVGIDFDDNGRVSAIEVAHTHSGERARLAVSELVLASGGLESTRLLLSTQRAAPSRFGGTEGPLGRYYMGHIMGEIADVVFASPKTAVEFDFHVEDGSYVRRRLVPSMATQLDHRLMNSAFWPVVPPVADARHGSSVLSMAYLALANGPIGRRVIAEAIRRRHIPETSVPLMPHVVNLLTGMPSAVSYSIDFLRRRRAKDYRLPGFFLTNSANRYGMCFNGEHAPNRESKVWLSNATDRLGLPSLAIDLRFAPEDADSLVRTHDLLDAWLRQQKLGYLDYRGALEDRQANILDLASNGTHQIGLARMAATAREGVVDQNLATFDAPNCYVASSAALPTSSQANPTLMTMALALRLSERIAKQHGR